jgi:hypothetical protein
MAPPAERRLESAADPSVFEALAAVSEAVESGAGLPEIARATSRALDLSVAIVDASSSVLAVACASPDDESAVLALSEGTSVLDLKVADAAVGQLRYRPRSGAPPPDTPLRMVGTLIALEVERSQAPDRASVEAVAGFLADLLDRRVTDRENIVARAHELGADVSGGASVLVVRAHPLHPEEGDWRARVVRIAQRGARAVTREALAAAVELAAWPGRRVATGNHAGERSGYSEPEIVIVAPSGDPDGGRRAAEAVSRELELGLAGYQFAVALSRPATDPVDLHRAGAEALLAANVAEARGLPRLAFEETGAYRLLLPAMSEDPGELQRFHEETVAPLVAYDEQYDTELVRTLESFLDSDGNVARTAEKLFTHRHTIRYRLERVKELTGLNVSSTDGRERLGLGLKAMRVLGILPPHGPASEPGAEAGRVPKDEKDR